MPTSVRSRQIINFLRVITTLSRSAWLLADCLKDPVNRTTWVGWGDDEETNSSLLEGGARPGKFPGPTSDRKMVCGQLYKFISGWGCCHYYPGDEWRDETRNLFKN